MDIFKGVDLAKLFGLSLSPIEIILRGSLTYLALFAILRLFKRESGTVGIADLLVIVLIADAAQNGLAGDYTSITEGVLLVATIVAWSYALDWLAHRSRRLERLLKPQPLLLVRDGRPLRRHLTQELITEDELAGQLRLHGIDDIARVKMAYLESDGRISVVPQDGQEGQDTPDKAIT